MKGTNIGPLASAAQFEKVQRLIKKVLRRARSWWLAASTAGGYQQRILREATVFAAYAAR